MYNWKKRLLAAVLAGCMTVGLMAPALATVGGEDTSSTAVDPGFSVDPVYPVEPTDPVEPVEPTPPVETEIPDGEIPLDPGFGMHDWANMSTEELYEVVKDLSDEDRAIVYSLLTEEQIAALEEYEKAMELPPVMDYEAMSNEELAEYIEPLEPFEAEQILLSLSQERFMDYYNYLCMLPEVQAILEEAAAEETVEAEDATPKDVTTFTDAAPLAGDTTSEVQSAQRRMAPFSMGPSTQGNPGDPGNAPEGLVMDKKVDAVDGQDDQYLITLESYATGDVKIETESKPLDIILVLDQSGSMADPIEYPYRSEVNCGRYFLGLYWGGLNNQRLYELASANSLFVRIGETDVPVSVTRKDMWVYYQYDYSYTYEGEVHSVTCTGGKGILEGANATRPADWNLYMDVSQTTRLNALKDVVEKFVGSVNEDAVAHGVNHRIAMVGFASDGSDYTNTEILIGNSEYKYGNSASGQYGNALQDVTTKGGLQNLYDSIGKLSANGATYPSYGLEMANGILNERTDATGRKSVIIVFTDGEPGQNSDSFDPDEASRAIEQAYSAKTIGSTVYTVGIFDGANPDDSTTNGNRFMNATSSNYPNATSFDEIGSKAFTGYYLTASNGNELEEVFENISESIGSTPVTLNANSVVKDVLTNEFKITDGGEVQAWTVPCTEVDADGAPVTWGTGTPVDSKNISSSGKTISVTGFDFATNYVGNHPEEHNYGSKLVIQIPITVDRSATFGGNGIYTNESSSGIYSDSTQSSPTGTFNRPTVDVPIRYEINGSVKYVCVGTATTRDDLIQYVEDYRPNAVNNAYVDITYTLKQGEAVVGTYTIPAGASEGTWSWETGYGAETAAMTACEEYTLSCAVEPATIGTEGPIYPTPATQPAIHVIVPTITWHDSIAESGTSVNLNDNQTSVQWTDVTTGHSEVPAGVEKPVLTYEFKVGEQAVENPESFVVTAETPVDVTVKVNGTDITQYVTFERTCATTPGHGGDHPGSNTECEFVIHLNNIDLSITKNLGEKPEQSFVFKVEGPDGFTMTIAMGDDEFQLENGLWTCTKKITGLKSGNYTVTEDQGWSWKYSVQGDARKEAVADSNQNLSVTFTNDRNSSNWLGGSHSVENHFAPVSGSSAGTIDTLDALVPPLPTGEKKQENEDDQKKTEPDPGEDPDLDGMTQEGGVDHV